MLTCICVPHGPFEHAKARVTTLGAAGDTGGRAVGRYIRRRFGRRAVCVGTIAAVLRSILSGIADLMDALAENPAPTVLALCARLGVSSSRVYFLRRDLAHAIAARHLRQRAESMERRRGLP